MQKIMRFYVAVKCRCKGGASLVLYVCCGGWKVEELER